MANKKLKVGARELKLPAKKSKEDKKPKWQAKTGGKKAKESAVETLTQEKPTLAAEATELPVVETTLGVPEVVPTTTSATAATPDTEPGAPDVSGTAETATNVESSPKKPRKLKVTTDLKPKKLSMIKAALQVLQDRKVPMTCPEMIDVMATESYGQAQVAKRQPPRLTSPYRFYQRPGQDIHYLLYSPRRPRCTNLIQIPF